MPKKAAMYHVEYDGYYTMKWHDDEQNALKRWFDNFKVDRHAGFATDYEWLVVKEVAATAKHHKTRMVCEIGDDGRGTKREVVMDHTAPPAPMLFFAAKMRYEPPPPKTTRQLRQEEEWARMTALGFEPKRVARRSTSIADFNPFTAVDGALMLKEIEYEWVPRQRSYNYFDMKPDFTYKAPAPPTHRRNV